MMLFIAQLFFFLPVVQLCWEKNIRIVNEHTTINCVFNNFGLPQICVIDLLNARSRSLSINSTVLILASSWLKTNKCKESCIIYCSNSIKKWFSDLTHVPLQKLKKWIIIPPKTGLTCKNIGKTTNNNTTLNVPRRVFGWGYCSKYLTIICYFCVCFCHFYHNVRGSFLQVCTTWCENSVYQHYTQKSNNFSNHIYK